MQVGGIGGRILWGAVAERLLPSRTVLALLGLMMAGGCAATAAFAPDWPLAVILGVAVVLGATSFGWNGVALSEVARLAPKGRTSDATGGRQFIMFRSDERRVGTERVSPCRSRGS